MTPLLKFSLLGLAAIGATGGSYMCWTNREKIYGYILGDGEENNESGNEQISTPQTQSQPGVRGPEEPTREPQAPVNPQSQQLPQEPSVPTGTVQSPQPQPGAGGAERSDQSLPEPQRDNGNAHNSQEIVQTQQPDAGRGAGSPQAVDPSNTEQRDGVAGGGSPVEPTQENAQRTPANPLEAPGEAGNDGRQRSDDGAGNPQGGIQSGPDNAGGQGADLPVDGGRDRTNQTNTDLNGGAPAPAVNTPAGGSAPIAGEPGSQGLGGGENQTGLNNAGDRVQSGPENAALPSPDGVGGTPGGVAGTGAPSGQVSTEGGNQPAQETPSVDGSSNTPTNPTTTSQTTDFQCLFSEDQSYGEGTNKKKIKDFLSTNGISRDGVQIRNESFPNGFKCAKDMEDDELGGLAEYMEAQKSDFSSPSNRHGNDPLVWAFKKKDGNAWDMFDGEGSLEAIKANSRSQGN